MSTITLLAHFDGKQICLDEAFELKLNTKLLVTILPDKETAEEERQDWYLLSKNGLARAFGEDEPEYPDSLIKEWNPDYERA